ncbi:receptor-like protein 4 isoform X2 [Physcomitrium patens]|uniref:Malectin-like domain-containing protein n=1 Tax=Physcomitrium patens TaxID=3218 RepID=A0A7I4ELV3_PHYPA
MATGTMGYETCAMATFLSLLLVSSLTLSAAQMSPASLTGSAGPYTVRIACGSSVETYDPNGYVWQKDWGFTGGSSAPLTFPNPKAPQIITLRYFSKFDGPENCYNITVPTGRYLIRLFFAFGEQDNAGREPQFDVSIEGTLVHNMDSGWSKERENFQDSLAFVSDGAATICFHSSGHGNPVVASIEVLQILDDAYKIADQESRSYIWKTMKRVSAGARKSGFGSDFLADPWGGDRYWESDNSLFLPGSIVQSISTVQNISNAAVTPNIYPMDIFQSATTTDPMQSLSYILPVDNNRLYSIWIYLAEISPFVVRPRDRVFDVLVNEEKIFSEVDIIAQAHRPFKALILNATVMVDDASSLELTFNPLFGPVAVNAFEIYELVPIEAPTLKTDMWAMQLLKQSLRLPATYGWNGDPCVPLAHIWFGVDCRFNNSATSWFIDGLYLDAQGVRGVLGEEIGLLSGLQILNISHNTLQGSIPQSMGNLSSLVVLDLSYNQLNSSIPVNLGNLPHLRKFVSNNEGLCGVGLRPCSQANSGGKAVRITAFVVSLVIVLTAGLVFLYWKKRANMARAQKLARGAPYAKARTTFVRDVQMARTMFTDHFRPAHIRDPAFAPIPSQSSTLLGST